MKKLFLFLVLAFTINVSIGQTISANDTSTVKTRIASDITTLKQRDPATGKKLNEILTGIIKSVPWAIQDNGVNISVPRAIVEKHAVTAKTATATLTAAELAKGVITNTKTGMDTLTLPTATAMATYLSSAGLGAQFEFIIDNTAGTDTCKVTAGSGMTAASAISGGTVLYVLGGKTGVYGLYFTSATAAMLTRKY